MAEAADYSKQLRSLGQQIDSLGMESFSVRVEPDGFVVTGRRQDQAPTKESSTTGLWQRLRRRFTPVAPAPAAELRVSFRAAELARLDAEAAEVRDRRSETKSDVEAHSTSQILRAVGAFVEEKQGQLLILSKDGQGITVEYESGFKARTVQRFTVLSLYDYWVSMYLNRGERSTPQ